MTVNGPAPIVPSFDVQQVPGAHAPPVTSDVPLPTEPSSRPPDGVDPELWRLLTPDEQSFFASQSIRGPLTYGPVHETSAADAPRGQRIDVRA